MNRYLCNHQYGSPQEVIALEECAVPEISGDEVLIRTTMAPVNPADINMIEGRYGEQPPLPAALGNEGVGIIEKVGSDVRDLSVGDQVITPTRRATWCDYRAVREKEAVRVPHDIPPEVACMLTINPLTALVMLENFCELQPGDYVIQNAANSALGRAVIDIAKRIGVKTVNIVRTHDQVEELEGFGGDMQMTFDDLKEKRYADQLKKISIPLAFNGVGGESARLLVKTLGHGGIMVTYGAMGKEPVILDNGPVIFKEICVKGFWRTHWVRNTDLATIRNVLERLIVLAEQGAFVVPIEKIYSFSQAAQALKHAQQSSRSGKVLLTP